MGGTAFLLAFLVLFAPLAPAIAVARIVARADGRRLRLLRILEIAVPAALAAVCGAIAYVWRGDALTLATILFAVTAFLGLVRPYPVRLPNPLSAQIGVYSYFLAFCPALYFLLASLFHWPIAP